MSTEDIIRAWKDPDGRDDDPGIDHPSGSIELTGGERVGGGNGVTANYLCLSLAISEFLDCKDSILHGTCGALTYGCCDNHFEQPE